LREHALRGGFDAWPVRLEGLNQLVRRSTRIAEMIVQRIHRNAAPDLLAADLRFECNTSCSRVTSRGCTEKVFKRLRISIGLFKKEPLFSALDAAPIVAMSGTNADGGKAWGECRVAAFSPSHGSISVRGKSGNHMASALTAFGSWPDRRRYPLMRLVVHSAMRRDVRVVCVSRNF
jgi:hypothetical protein